MGWEEGVRAVWVLKDGRVASDYLDARNFVCLSGHSMILGDG